MKRTPLKPGKPPKRKTPLTFGSLFAGIGGFDLGFERAGMRCEWQVEIDDYANRVLEKHWRGVRRHRDIRTFPPEPIGEWRVDVVCGGFPCQDISYAGRGAGLEGERSGLFYEAMRVVRVLEPRWVVLENVAALLTRGLPEVLGTLASLGFDAEWHCLPAAAVGAPHNRDRCFVTGRLRNCGMGDASSRRLYRDHGELLEESEVSTERGPSVADADRPRLEERSSVTIDTREELAPTQRNGDLGNTPKWWCVEPDVGRVANGVPDRVDRLRGLGNAVVPQVAEFIGRAIVEHHEENPT